MSPPLPLSLYAFYGAQLADGLVQALTTAVRSPALVVPLPVTSVDRCSPCYRARGAPSNVLSVDELNPNKGRAVEPTVPRGNTVIQ